MSRYVKLYCKKNRIKKNGESPIYFVIKLKGKERLLYTGKTIAPKMFSNHGLGEAINKVKNGKLNSFLIQEVAKFNNIIINMELKKDPLSFEKILSTYCNLDSQDCFIKFYESELESLKAGMAKNTYRDYHVSLNNLKEFAPSLTFNDLDYKFLVRFETWLKQKGRNQNSRYRNFTAIRKFLNLAIRYGLTENYPFKDFKFSPVQVEREYVTEPELTSLQQLFDQGKLRERHANTLANFLFTCYTGISADDMRNKERINFNGTHISFVRGKTGKIVKIPLTSKAARMLPEVQKRPLKLSASKTHCDLKEIMKIAFIDKHITYHAGRHTFAIISLMKGISLSVISKVLGHTSTKTTEIYAKVVDDLLNTEMSKWDD
jgi:site-specific recombinase XerD